VSCQPGLLRFLNMKSTIPCIAAAVVIAACDSPTDLARVPGALQTDQLSYQLRTTTWGLETEIGVTYTNHRREPVFLARRCHDGYAVALHKKEGDDWVTGLNVVVPDCLGEVIPLGAGESFRITIGIDAGAKGSNNYPQFEPATVDGDYRLELFDVYLSDPTPLTSLRQAPRAYRVSNTFTLDAP